MLCDPYETFVMLLKSRSRTHHPNMHYSYTGGEHKNMLVRFPLKKNVQNPCCYLSKDLLQKRGMAMQKLFKKKLKKWTSVRDIKNNGYSDARLKKEKNR